MVIKNYSVSLDEEVVVRARELWLRDDNGKKLSPLINKLLLKWIKQEVTKNGRNSS